VKREPRWIGRVVVEAIHYDQLGEHGGLRGLRDEAALEAALARPQNKWHYKPGVDLATLAAAYAFGIAQNHPFHDGNKRVAFVTMVVFLELNGQRFAADDADVVTTIMELAAGNMSERRLTTWIRKHTTS
jgi:death-on-curing protein